MSKENTSTAGARTHKIEVIMGDGSETPAAVREAVERKIAEMPQAGERTQHTPGPWTFGFRPKGVAQVLLVEDLNMLPIAHVFGLDDQPSQANARLIAAAPELLEALKAALPVLDDAEQEARHVNKTAKMLGVAELFAEQARSARAAIAKAEGEIT